MRIRKLYYTLLLFFCFWGQFTQLVAQEEKTTYTKASELYEMGQFEEAIEVLGPALNASEINKTDQINAYRIMALSCMQLHLEEGAQNYTTQLLMINPNYSNPQDPPRFTDLVNKLKKNSITIETASQQAEKIEESPVPVTLISEEMIQASGAQNLRDLLAMYVPGISIIEGSSSNIAMRGTYSANQETILILLNGQRLNCSANNTESLDQRTSLEKVKRIEVLRGPASSLYGNVALSAVVNIITKRGAELDGHQVSGKLGSYGYKEFNFMTGLGSVGQDIMAWGSIMSSTGQKQTLASTTHYVGGYNGKPTYDLGMRGNWKDLTLQFTMQHSKLVPYYPVISLTDAWSYDKYGKSEGEKPGTYRQAIHGLVSWSHNWKNKYLKVQAAIDSENAGFYNVMADHLDTTVASFILAKIGFSGLTPMTEGVWQNITWHALTASASIQGGIDYKWGEQYGNILAGIQYEHFNLDEGQMIMGDQFNQTEYTLEGMQTDSPEKTLSGFLQLKHNFSSNFILNSGIRYDYKKRQDKSHIDNVSPRAALIWLPNKDISVQMGYSVSFVDAPYLYRTFRLTIYSGGGDLKPEKLNAFQLGTTINLLKKRLVYKGNFFLTKAKDVVIYNLGKISSGTTYAMYNSGLIKIYGMENSLKYQNEKTLLNTTITYQHPSGKNELTHENGMLYNVPSFLLNSVIQHRLTKDTQNAFYVRGNLHLQDKIQIMTSDMLSTAETSECHQNGYAVFNLGADYVHQSIKFSVDVYNLLNTNYKLGGMTKSGVPQQGRSVIGKIQYNF